MASSFAPRYIIPKNINVQAIINDSEDNSRNKCFTKFIDESYLSGALFNTDFLSWHTWEILGYYNMRDDCLREWWWKMVITFQIVGVSTIFDVEDMNKTLGLLTKDLAEETTDRPCQLIKKYMRKKWSFVFDTMLKVFTCRKIGWEHISYMA